MRDHAVTFHKTDELTWTNRETGVTIERVFRDGWSGYEVRRPYWVGKRTSVRIASRRLLSEARQFAKDYVVRDSRIEIAAAYDEAWAELAQREIDAAYAALSEVADRLGEDDKTTVRRWYSAAYQSAQRGEHRRARAFAREAVSFLANARLAAGQPPYASPWAVDGRETPPAPGDIVRRVGEGAYRGTEWQVVDFAADRLRVKLIPVDPTLRVVARFDDWANVDLIRRAA